MIPQDDFRLFFSWTTSTTHCHPYHTVLLYCMINLVLSVLFSLENHVQNNRLVYMIRVCFEKLSL